MSGVVHQAHVRGVVLAQRRRQGLAVAFTSYQRRQWGARLTLLPRRTRNVAAAPAKSPPRSPGDGTGIAARPDGYYWVASQSRQEFGPFETYEAAVAHRDAFTDAAWEPGETLREAESEIGIADWIDPLTGELAQGQSPPHIEDD